MDLNNDETEKQLLNDVSTKDQLEMVPPEFRSEDPKRPLAFTARTKLNTLTSSILCGLVSY